MPEDANERRRFQRIATDKRVTVESNGVRHAGKVLDISLRGLLFELDADWRPVLGSTLRAVVELDQGLPGIAMDGEAAHVQGSRVGLHCIGMDLESASLLRRMLELNLADSELLERDLKQLIAG